MLQLPQAYIESLAKGDKEQENPPWWYTFVFIETEKMK